MKKAGKVMKLASYDFCLFHFFVCILRNYSALRWLRKTFLLF